MLLTAHLVDVLCMEVAKKLNLTDQLVTKIIHYGILFKNMLIIKKYDTTSFTNEKLIINFHAQQNWL